MTQPPPIGIDNPVFEQHFKRLNFLQRGVYTVWAVFSSSVAGAVCALLPAITVGLVLEYVNQVSFIDTLRLIMAIGIIGGAYLGACITVMSYSFTLFEFVMHGIGMLLVAQILPFLLKPVIGVMGLSIFATMCSLLLLSLPVAIVAGIAGYLLYLPHGAVNLLSGSSLKHPLLGGEQHIRGYIQALLKIRREHRVRWFVVPLHNLSIAAASVGVVLSMSPILIFTALADAFVQSQIIAIQVILKERKAIAKKYS